MEKRGQEMKSKIPSVSIFSSKKAQMQLSFGMIFSIFLIIIFIVFAFFAIQKFLFTQKDLQHKQFLTDFQNDVDKMWKASQSSQDVSYAIPNSIKQVCIVKECSDLGLEFNCYSPDDNLVFNSTKKNFDSAYINHLDVENIISVNNRMLCFNVMDGKIYMNLVKKYGNEKVGVSQVQS